MARHRSFGSEFNQPSTGIDNGEPRIWLEPDTDRVLTLTMSIPFIGRLVDYAGARKVILSATSGCVFGGKLTAL
jgi:hypothetical protein